MNWGPTRDRIRFNLWCGDLKAKHELANSQFARKYATRDRATCLACLLAARAASTTMHPFLCPFPFPSPSPTQFPCFAYFTQIFFTAQRFDTSVPQCPYHAPPPRGRQAFCIIAKSYYAVAFRVYRFVLHTLRLVESFSIYKRVFFPVLFSVLFLLYIFPVFSPGFCCILCSLCSFA